MPAVVDVASSASTTRRQHNVPPCRAEPGAGTIEVEIDGVTIRVGRGALQIGWTVVIAPWVIWATRFSLYLSRYEGSKRPEPFYFVL
jgi:hypothetical protein